MEDIVSETSGEVNISYLARVIIRKIGKDYELQEELVGCLFPEIKDKLYDEI